jgi:tyrosinase
LTPAERIDYIDALHCLAEKPPVYDTHTYPGVRNRWDDFVACVQSLRYLTWEFANAEQNPYQLYALHPFQRALASVASQLHPPLGNRLEGGVRV